WALTAGWRRRELGSACLKFDPTAAASSSARYNPLLEVRPWPDDVKDAQGIADLLIDPAGTGGHDHWDLHWNLTAHDLLVGVILLNLYREPIVAQHTEACDFALTDLLRTDRRVSLYLTTPPSDITRTRPLLRLLLNQLGRRLTETLDPGSGRVGSQPRPRLLL